MRMKSNYTSTMFALPGLVLSVPCYDRNLLHSCSVRCVHNRCCPGATNTFTWPNSFATG